MADEMITGNFIFGADSRRNNLLTASEKNSYLTRREMINEVFVVVKQLDRSGFIMPIKTPKL